jgi:hypothetical protein
MTSPGTADHHRRASAWRPAGLGTRGRYFAGRWMARGRRPRGRSDDRFDEGAEQYGLRRMRRFGRLVASFAPLRGMRPHRML